MSKGTAPLLVSFMLAASLLCGCSSFGSSKSDAFETGQRTGVCQIHQISMSRVEAPVGPRIGRDFRNTKTAIKDGKEIPQQDPSGKLWICPMCEEETVHAAPPQAVDLQNIPPVKRKF